MLKSHAIERNHIDRKIFRIKNLGRHFYRFCRVIQETPTAVLQGPGRAAGATRYVTVIIPCKRLCCPVTRKRRIPRDARWSFWSRRRTSQRSWISPRALRRISTTRLCEGKARESEVNITIIMEMPRQKRATRSFTVKSVTVHFCNSAKFVSRQISFHSLNGRVTAVTLKMIFLSHNKSDNQLSFYK